MKDGCPASQSVTPAAPVEAVGGVVFRKNRRKQIVILLIKKQGGFWTLPKGHVEPGEGQIEAARREVREETGISSKVQQPVCTVSYMVLKRNVPRTKVVTYYLMRATDGRLRPSKKEKIERVKWFTLPQALKRVRRARVRSIVQQAAALLEQPPPNP